MLKKYYVTFGQSSKMKDGWAEVWATSSEEARKKILEIFGQNWSMMYTEEEFNASYFPQGCLETLV